MAPSTPPTASTTRLVRISQLRPPSSPPSISFDNVLSFFIFILNVKPPSTDSISYGDGDIALSYGAILRECIRHQVVARYVLESDHMKKFFDYIQLPNFEIASDAAATFKELMTRHKSTVAQFLSNNYDWFFQEYNSQLLESQNYITKRQAIKIGLWNFCDVLHEETFERGGDSEDNQQEIYFAI
ncbi:putative armadillo-like helical protein [Rosa chinensis]|uniref:Putative armadillo-like helical protein n=1 Tax=Rosa chinensis TaxID=74649 RepID=A0A2P6QEA6_ROSCH|nr:putative MO25-like protein At5g47540 [Rosa chinensis]PRQ32528.1 putative armadillo-like helical protein [Rosa chinensis]